MIKNKPDTIRLERRKGIYALQLVLNLIENQQKELDNIKEIEKSHKEENGKLRVELEQEKEKNKYYEERIVNQMCSEEFKKLHEEIFKTVKNDYISKDKIKKFIDEELPEEEICKSCDIYDVNGISLKEKLEKILEV